MLHVVKAFTEEVKNDKQWGAESKGTATVMLDVQLTPELKRMGLSREVTNRIQRLRKNSGISIEDQIDIFYEIVGESPELTQTLDAHASAIQETARMPVVHLSDRQGDKSAPFIGETEFIDPDNEAEQVKIYIYLATPVFNDEAL